MNYCQYCKYRNKDECTLTHEYAEPNHAFQNSDKNCPLKQASVEEIKKDIQFLLIMYEAYLNDSTSSGSSGNEYFMKMKETYGFNKDNFYKGFEHLF